MVFDAVLLVLHCKNSVCSKLKRMRSDVWNTEATSLDRGMWFFILRHLKHSATSMQRGNKGMFFNE
jgi:hypothetical protein